MKILNFAHPLTEDQLIKTENLAGTKISAVIDIPNQIDPNRPIEPQVEAMLEHTGLAVQEWQTVSLLINLPSLNYSAVALLAQLHGRMGYFPPVLRLCPNTEGIAPRFEIAEILNLQAMRERGRGKRV